MNQPSSQPEPLSPWQLGDSDLYYRLLEMCNLAWSSEQDMIAGAFEDAFLAPADQEALSQRFKQAFEATGCKPDGDEELAEKLGVSVAHVKWLVAMYGLATGTHRAPDTAIYTRWDKTGKRANQP